MASEPPLNPRGWNSLETDDRFPNWQGWPGAVLLNDEIEYYANDGAARLLKVTIQAMYARIRTSSMVLSRMECVPSAGHRHRGKAR